MVLTVYKMWPIQGFQTKGDHSKTKLAFVIILICDTLFHFKASSRYCKLKLVPNENTGLSISVIHILNPLYTGKP